MRFGASLGVRFDDPVAEYVGFLADLGLSHVEIRQGYLDCNPVAADPGLLRDVVAETGVTLSVHAPHRDCNLANLTESLRRAAVEGVKRSLDLAAAAGAGAVVVHGGSVGRDYPDRVRSRARSQAVESLRACARHAADVEVPLCLENQRDKSGAHRFTATPARMRALRTDVGVDSPYFGVTLDVGHAKATGVDPARFVDRFGDDVRVVHLHDNDGTGDDHDPLPDFRDVARGTGADYGVLEMKSRADVRRCVEEVG
jgi:sugar phosphate isomerase/epimerase